MATDLDRPSKPAFLDLTGANAALLIKSQILYTTLAKPKANTQDICVIDTGTGCTTSFPSTTDCITNAWQTGNSYHAYFSRE